MAESGAQSFDAGGSGRDLWTFKQGGQVFGPVLTSVILERLFRGEIGADTWIARESAEDFRPLGEVPFFSLHLAKAQAKLKVEREAAVQQAAARRGRRTRILVIAVLLTSSVGVAISAAYWSVQRRQHELEGEVDDIPITPNPPELAAAAGEADVSFPAPAGAAPAVHHPVHHPVAGAVGTSGTTAPEAKDGLTAPRYDKNSIIGAEVRQKASLIPCIREELHRTDYRGDVRFSLAIGNDGKVAKLWMEDPRFKEGPLQSCFWSAMGRWHFATYDGERATLSDSFHVGR
jgi:hypothetical protein